MMLSRTGWGETSLPVAFQTVGGRRAPWGCAAGAPYRGTASPPPPPPPCSYCCCMQNYCSFVKKKKGVTMAFLQVVHMVQVSRHFRIHGAILMEWKKA